MGVEWTVVVEKAAGIDVLNNAEDEGALDGRLAGQLSTSAPGPVMGANLRHQYRNECQHRPTHMR